MYINFEDILKWFNGMLSEVILDTKIKEVFMMLTNEGTAIITEVLKLFVDIIRLILDDHPHDLAFLSKEIPFRVFQGKNSPLGNFLVFDKMLDVLQFIDLMHGLNLHPLEMILNR